MSVSLYRFLECLILCVKVLTRHRVYLPFFTVFTVFSGIVAIVIATGNYVDYEADVFLRRLAIDGFSLAVCSGFTDCVERYGVEPTLCVGRSEVLLGRCGVEVYVMYVDVHGYGDELASRLRLFRRAEPGYLSIGYEVARRYGVSKGVEVVFVGGKRFRVVNIHRTNTVLDMMALLFVEKLPKGCEYYMAVVRDGIHSVFRAIVYGLDREVYKAISTISIQLLLLNPVLAFVLVYRAVHELRREIESLLTFGSDRLYTLTLPLAIAITYVIASVMGMAIAIASLDMGTWIARVLGIYFPYKPFLKPIDIAKIVSIPLPLTYISSLIALIATRRRL